MPIFSCPRCTTPLQIPEQAEGQLLDCPKCEQRLLIPAVNAPPPPVGAFQVAPTVRFGAAGAAAGGDRESSSLLHFVPALTDEPPRLSIPKPLFFALAGALGCLIAAILFEYPLYLLTPAPAENVAKPVVVIPEVVAVDVVFVLDVTGSMSDQIEGVRQGIERFVDGLKGQKMDVQVGLVSFRDRFGDMHDPPEDSKELLFAGKPFTRDPALFRRQMAGLTASGGGDAPESGLDALDHASKLPFRKDAAKVLIFITDAPPRIPDKDNRDEKQVADKLIERKIQQLHLVVRDDPERYLEIQRIMGRARRGKEGGRELPKGARGDPSIGKVFDLNDIGGRRGGLEKVLEGTTAEIAEEARRQATVGGLSVQGEYQAEDAWQLVGAVGLWTAGLALGLTLALILSSKRYLRQAALGWGLFLKGGLSLLAGLGGGLLAQGLVLLLTFNSSEGTTRIVLDLIATASGWTLLGGIVGLALAFFVPNLSWFKGLFGGSLGGFAGALFFLIFTALIGDWLGRWLGALALGFCVGMMVALVETVFRRWWLEVRFGTGEVRTVTLGPERVSVGADPLKATIVLPEGPAIAYRFYTERGRVVCEDNHGVFKLDAGEVQQVGDTTITVRSPEHSNQLGMVLELSNGKTIPLSAGLPLTAEDISGLKTSAPDGAVALVSPHADQPDSLWLRNRSKNTWHVPTGPDQKQAVEPGQSIPLMPGMVIEFGAVEGRLSRPRIYQRPVSSTSRVSGRDDHIVRRDRNGT